MRDFTFFRHKITIFKQKSTQIGGFYRQKLADSENKTYICTEFKHKIIKSKQLFGECVLSLQQKKILMVKVYG